jgi:hypothetical protein
MIVGIIWRFVLLSFLDQIWRIFGADLELIWSRLGQVFLGRFGACFFGQISRYVNYVLTPKNHSDYSP